MDNRMQFYTCLTVEPEVGPAIQSLVEDLGNQLNGRAPDLVLVFLSTAFSQSARKIGEILRAEFRPRLLLGCTAEGVIGQESEIEEQPAIALLAGVLPGVELMPFMLAPGDLRVILSDSEEFQRCIEAPQATRLILMLADPFSISIDEALEAFDRCYPGVPVAGGLASGALRPEGNILILDDQLSNGGAVGVALSGSLEVDVVVSQGCRPIWRPFTIIDSDKNLIFNLEGRPPLALIEDLIPELPEEDRLLLGNGLFIGRSICPDQEELGPGDFLVRGVVAVDPQTGAIAVGDHVHDGERIQFHLRDAVSAVDDLEMMLVPQTFRSPPEGALLFACNGRGTRLYDHANGDISVIRRNLGSFPLAGFFCAGELGPVGGKNYLHGNTASLVLFRSIL